MKITIYETRKIKKEIDIEFPYYFKWEFNTTKLFGKIINEKECIEISDIRDDFYIETSYEIKITEPDESYYKIEDKSCEYEFEAAKERILKFIGKV